MKKRKEKVNPKEKKKQPKAEQDSPDENEYLSYPGVLPKRDLKKNLGCG